MNLHITNGDGARARLERMFPQDTVLPWRDALHDGPAPAGLALDQLSEVRAQYWAECGWGTREARLEEFRERDALLARHGEFAETILWFEHDLYDQLQLVQVLDWFRRELLSGRRPNVTLVQSSEFLTSLNDLQLLACFQSRRIVTREQLELAALAWGAFRDADPRGLEELLTPREALPHLGAALQRWCEEFPWLSDGLTRTQRSVQQLREAGIYDRQELYEKYSETENPHWLGDTSFFRILDGQEPAARSRTPGWFWDATQRRFVHRPS